MASGSIDPVVKYVTGKVSKVRWKPLPSGSIGSSDVFVSGSWDEEVLDYGMVGSIWNVFPSPNSSILRQLLLVSTSR